MNCRQKLIEYIRSHPDPFTLKAICEATDVPEHTCRGYLCEFVQSRMLGYAEPKAHKGFDKTLAVNRGWKPRKYQKTAGAKLPKKVVARYAKRPTARKPATAKVPNTRCLGPGKEHTFDSPDPVNIRICPRCRGERQPPIRDMEDGNRGRQVDRHRSQAT